MTYWGLRDYGTPGQLGLEPTPDAYVAQLVAVFREVWRVLRDDGTLWLNLGDSYAGSYGAQSREHAGKHAPNVSALSANQVKAAQIRQHGTGSLSRTPGCKPKDLVGIPWRVAFALQANGWYLRSDIIWSKPNPMPESVTDRPTRAHEYLFLLTKSKLYYYDADAISEQLQTDPRENYPGRSRVIGRGGLESISQTPGGQPHQRSSGGLPPKGEKRNRRSVWHIPTQPYSGAHFATFPEKLVEPCILAGSRRGDVVLDPFCGSGTVGVVALCQQRKFIGCDLSAPYLQLAKQRIYDRAPLVRGGDRMRSAYTEKRAYLPGLVGRFAFLFSPSGLCGLLALCPQLFWRLTRFAGESSAPPKHFRCRVRLHLVRPTATVWSRSLWRTAYGGTIALSVTNPSARASSSWVDGTSKTGSVWPATPVGLWPTNRTETPSFRSTARVRRASIPANKSFSIAASIQPILFIPLRMSSSYLLGSIR